jgi:hypothetical protein
MADQEQREKQQRTHHGSVRHVFGPGDGRDVELVFNAFRPDSSGVPLPPVLTVGGEIDDLRLLFAPDGSGTAYEVLTSGHVPPSLSAWINGETPAGVINGVNDTFTITRAPTLCLLYKNGVYQLAGGTDYTLASTTITYVALAIPQAGDWHYAILIG